MQRKVLLMQEEFGWACYKLNDKVLWFKGYLLTTNYHKIFIQLDALTKKKFLLISDFQRILNRTKGHFAFVFYWDDNVFASVDKVRSIPICYLNNSQHQIISNNVFLLKEFAGLDDSSLLESSALEIAMSGYTIGSKTLYKNLYQLTAGECLLISQNELKKYFYYTYSPWKVDYRNKDELKTQMTDCLVKSFEDLIESVGARQVVVPLSAGSDSRLVASALKYLGYKNVLCFAYGSYDNYETQTSRNVAKRLGYSWVNVPLTLKSQKLFFDSKEFEDYCNTVDIFASTPYMQDVSAVGWLKNNKIISDDAVFVNGNTGDFISGGHIPLSLKKESFGFTSSRKIYDDAWDDFLEKHFSLWGALRSKDNDNAIKNSLNALLLQREVPDIQDLNKLHGLFECLEYLGRQSKYIINMQRSYDFYGYSWRVPLWSDQMLGFWEGVPRNYKLNQNLYKGVLKENNWGGVWDNVPVNSGKIGSNSLIFARFISKVAFFPLGVDSWHAFERRVFQYLLDDTAHSSIVPYYKVLFDSRGQRNWVSWLTEKYLNNKGFEDISNEFPRRNK